MKMLGTIFERFVEESPVSVMMRGLMERVFAPEQINRIFEENAKTEQCNFVRWGKTSDR